MADLDGSDDFFDSRDVIARIEELESEETWTREEREEHEELTDFASNAAGQFVDWEYGVTFIHEDAFQDYAEELARDTGAITDNQSWPLNHIDWEAAADDLRTDFTAIDLYDSTYYAR